MDSHDLPRSLVPARLPSTRPLSGLSSRPVPAVPEAAPSPQILRVALRGARRYWWLLLGFWALGTAGLASAIYLKVDPLFESESYLRVEDKQQNIYNGAGADNLNTLLETLVTLIGSPNVLAAAAVDPKAAELPRIRYAPDVVLELRKVLIVRAIPNTFLIRVSMASKDPFESAIIVNAVVNAFLKANREWSEGMTTAQINNLEAYLAQLQAQADDLEKRWKGLVEKGDVDSQVFGDKPATARAGAEAEAGGDRALSSRATITVEEAKAVQKQLLQVDLDLATAEAWVEDVRNLRKVPKAKDNQEAAIREQIARRFQADPEVMQLGEEMLDVQDKIKDVRHKSNLPGDPAERRFAEQLRRLKDRYERMWATKSAQYRELIEQNGSDPDAEIRDAETKLRALRIQKSSLEKRVGELRVARSQQSTDEVEIRLIIDERNAIKGMQDLVHRKLDDLKFSSKDGARVRLNNEAVPAGRPMSDNRLKYLAMTPVGVLLASLGLVVLLELRSGRVSDPDLLSSRVRHEVFPVAPLPNIRPGDDGRGGRSEQKLARFVQSLDHLRVALCDGGVPGEGRCVLITSATGGEGKTTLSAHLAARCANAGTSILLIDADLRRASLGRLLDVPAGPGLADVLNGEVGLEDALITMQAGGFHFLSAGTPGRDPSRVLTSSRLSALIQQLRATYDLVLIDSPPILPVPDALLMGRHVDGVVMASRLDASRLPLVERASRQLAAANIPVLGVVVNGARPQAAEYGQYHYAYQSPHRDEAGPAEAEDAQA